MFTIDIRLRFALIALGFVLGIGLWIAYGFWYGFPFLLVGIFMLAGYLLMGTVMSSFLKIQKGDMAGAEKQLALTFFPNLLFSMMRSQYYMAQSTIAMQKKDLNGAAALTKKGMKVGFSSDNERAIALFQLAGIAAQKGNRLVAQNHINEIKKLTITEPMIKEQLKEFEKQLKMLQQAKSHGVMMGGQRPGFRPKQK